MALISNGSMMLLKYKLNNVCDADNISANDAQITEQFLYTTIYCDCQYEIAYILCFLVGEKLIRIISVLNAYWRFRKVMHLPGFPCLILQIFPHGDDGRFENILNKPDFLGRTVLKQFCNVR